MRVRVPVGMAALALVGAGCSSSSPKVATPAAAGSISLGIAGLDATGPIGVISAGSATQTVRADLAYVLISESQGNSPIPGFTIGPNGQPDPTPTSAPAASDHDAIRTALRPLGIASDAIEFSFADPAGAIGGSNSEAMQIEVPIAKLPQIASAVVAAVKAAGVSVSGQALHFAVLDCGASAEGVGEVTGPADSGDIFIAPQPFTGPDPTAPQSTIDSAAVLHALAPLGIAKTAVEIENPPNLSQFSSSSSSSSYVRVHVTLAQLKSSGTKIASAVQSVVGNNAPTGVLFGAANCNDLVTRARVAAVRDAGRRLAKLAVTAKAHLGAIVGVAEPSTNLALPDLDPCKPDLSSLGGISALTGLSTISGSPSLSALDATPQITEQVSLTISRAMTS